MLSRTNAVVSCVTSADPWETPPPASKVGGCLREPESYLLLALSCNSGKLLGDAKDGGCIGPVHCSCGVGVAGTEDIMFHELVALTSTRESVTQADCARASSVVVS